MCRSYCPRYFIVQRETGVHNTLALPPYHSQYKGAGQETPLLRLCPASQVNPRSENASWRCPFSAAKEPLAGASVAGSLRGNSSAKWKYWEKSPQSGEPSSAKWRSNDGSSGLFEGLFTVIIVKKRLSSLIGYGKLQKAFKGTGCSVVTIGISDYTRTFRASVSTSFSQGPGAFRTLPTGTSRYLWPLWGIELTAALAAHLRQNAIVAGTGGRLTTRVVFDFRITAT